MIQSQPISSTAHILISFQPIQVTTPHRSNHHLHVVEFEPTPVMSTYGLAFAVGEFELAQRHVGTFPKFINIGLHTPLGRSGEGQFALDWIQGCIEFYQDYFDIPLKMDKLDILSLSSHVPGGLGNWSLITCHESEFLLEPAAEDDIEAKILIARTVSHLIAHQWIGSLVSMDWWNSLWVTEGLLTVLEYTSIHSLEPELDMWHRFVGDVVLKALEADALRSTHPLDGDVQYSEIKEGFDVISSGKGAVILRMCHQYIGESLFQTGIQEYLKRFSHGTASSVDFLNLLEEVSKKPVRALFDVWIKKSGFPLLKIEDFECYGSTRVVTVVQEAFLPETIDSNYRSYLQRASWIIPIQVSLARNPYIPVKEFLMEKRIQRFKIQDTNFHEWFLVNYT